MPMCPCPVDGCDYEAVVIEEQGSRGQQVSIFLPISQEILCENGGFRLYGRKKTPVSVNK